MRITWDLNDALHSELIDAAAERKTTVQQFVGELVESELATRRLPACHTPLSARMPIAPDGEDYRVQLNRLE